MLSNFELVHLYNTTAMPSEEMQTIMLKSAKENLLRMTFLV